MQDFLRKTWRNSIPGTSAKGLSGRYPKTDFGAQVVERESNEGGSRFFVWWTITSEENGGQNPDYNFIWPGLHNDVTSFC